MAISQFKVKVGHKGKAVAHANYVMREDKYGDSFGKHANKKDKEVEYISFGNMPDWIDNNPLKFWEMADGHERENGTVYREQIISLPRELNFKQRIELIEFWITQEIGTNHAYQYAIHNPPALDGGEQPHVHLMYSERLNDGLDRSPDTYFKRYNSKHPERGGARKNSVPSSWTDRKAKLKEVRSHWEIVCNTFLEKYGFDERIDMRNWKERGLEEKPENISMKDMQNPVIKMAYIEKLATKKALAEAEREIEQLDIEITDSRLSETKQRVVASKQRVDSSQREINRAYRGSGSGDIGVAGQVEPGQSANYDIADESSEKTANQQRIDRSQQQIDASQQRFDTVESRLVIINGYLGQASARIEETNKTIGATNKRVSRNQQRLADTKRRTTESQRAIGQSQQRINEYRLAQQYKLAQEKAKKEQDQKAKRQAEEALAEKRRIEQKQKEIENNRLAFERTMMPHIEQHFKDVRKAGIEFNYEFTEYSLYRAVKATTSLHTCAELGDKQGFMDAFVDYKNATVGENQAYEHNHLNRLAKSGKIGIFEKFKQRDFSGIHYEWDKPVHLQLKQVAINIFRAINNVIRKIVDFAKSIDLISGKDEIKYDKTPYSISMPFDKFTDNVESKLVSEEERMARDMKKLTNNRSYQSNKP